MQANALYNNCGGKTVSFPQRTIYDNLREHNVSFSMFMNSTCGRTAPRGLNPPAQISALAPPLAPPHAGRPRARPVDGKPCHGEDPITPDSPSAISTPDVAMEGVARYKERFMSQERFYQQAATGELPALSWVHPPIQACDHPCQDLAKGERLLKDVVGRSPPRRRRAWSVLLSPLPISACARSRAHRARAATRQYEALRAGPKWKNTLLLVTYDDAGGYYDHVVPPFEGVPADDAPCNLGAAGWTSSCGEPFDFRRLGLRTTGMLISPWVAKGAVFQEPKHGPTPTSQFELTSVAATVKTLFNLSSFLTKRDAWAGTFEELLLDEPRPDSDMPMHLPTAPAPAKPWDPPPGQALGPPAGHALRRAAVDPITGAVSEEPVPQHCSTRHGGPEEQCRGADVPNLKQRRNAKLLAGLMGAPEPDVDAMTYAEAEVWIGKHWRAFMERA